MDRFRSPKWRNTTPDLASPPLTPTDTLGSDDADLALREAFLARLITALGALLIAALVLRCAL